MDLCFGDIPAGPGESDIALLYTDNCGGAITVTKSGSATGDDCSWSVTYTYRVFDKCGNEVLPSPTITYSGGDKTPPEFTAPEEITICRDISGDFDRDPVNTGEVIDASDNCTVLLIPSYSDNEDSMGTVDEVGFITRTWIVTDNCGNVTTHDQIIWVQPVPRISVDVVDTLLCNGETVKFAIDSLVISRGEVMYNLEVTYPAGVSGMLTDGQRHVEELSDQLINGTNSYHTVTYHFRPYIQGKPGDPTCMDGVEVTVNIHVDPTPVVSLDLADDNLCNGESVSIGISTITNAYRGVEFNVTATGGHPDISGHNGRTGLTVADLIDDALTNSGDTVRTVTYEVRPVTLDVNGNQKCEGPRQSVTVWVNPTPRATPLNIKPHICYGDDIAIELLSPTVMRYGVNEFDYTISSTASTAIVSGDRDPQSGVAPATRLQFPYTNESDTVQSVFFHITPRVAGSGCSDGPAETVEVKVHAHPLQSLEIRDSITCDGGQNGTLEIIHAKGFDQLWVEWTGPDHWADAGNNLFIVDDRMQGLYTAKVTDSLGCNSSAWLNLMAPYTDIALYFDAFISCPGAENARLIMALTEGKAPPYTYYLVRDEVDTVSQGLMPPLGDPITIGNLKPGNYRVTVVDANKCRKDFLRTLYDAPATVASLEKSVYGDYNVECIGYSTGRIAVKDIYSYYMNGSDTVIATTSRKPFTYQWTDSDGNILSTGEVLEDVPAGTYTLTVTDRLGCQFHFTETITEPEGIDLISSEISLSADGNYQVSCHGGSDGFINLRFNNINGPYTYNWTGPGLFAADTPSVTGLSAGIYFLSVVDANGCHRPYQFTLTEPDSLSIAVDLSLTVDGAYNIACNGDDGTIDITVAGGSGDGTYTFKWTRANDPGWTGSDEDLTVGAGTYHLQVTDLNGCTNSRTITLTEPDPLRAELSVSDITCLNAPANDDGAIELTATGGRAPYTYSWTGPSGFTSAQKDISSLTPGTYNVTVTDAYGCTTGAEAILNLPEPLSLNFLASDYNGFNISCLGRSDGWLKVIPQTGTAPYTYSWTRPGGLLVTGTDSIGDLVEGTYRVTVTDRHLCTVTQDIQMLSPGPLSMILNIGLSDGGGYNINCNAASSGRVAVTAVNAAGTPAYLWSDGQTGAVRDNLPAGWHGVILTDANRCVTDTSFTLTEPAPLKIDFSLVSPYCPESEEGRIFAGVSGGEGVYTFRWSDGQTTQEATGLVQGIYRVEVSDFNGCKIIDTLNLKALNPICVGIPNAFSPNGDGINDYWNIDRIGLYHNAEVIILNRWGEMVWKSERGYPQPWDGRASDGRKLPMDSYHYAIDLHNGSKPIVGHVTIIR